MSVLCFLYRHFCTPKSVGIGGIMNRESRFANCYDVWFSSQIHGEKRQHSAVNWCCGYRGRAAYRRDIQACAMADRQRAAPGRKRTERPSQVKFPICGWALVQVVWFCPIRRSVCPLPAGRGSLAQCRRSGNRPNRRFFRARPVCRTRPCRPEPAHPTRPTCRCCFFDPERVVGI